ncbi:MAG: acyl CoA:acetate/3-ketoacid CoA transferase, partial [Methyloceanibacter sp.]
EIRIPVEGMPKMPLDARKIIARRAAFELPPNGAVNLGVGVPDGVAAIANEEKVTPYITLTTEAGAVGGVLAGGSSFGSSANAHAVIDQNTMFDFYDGGGLDLTCLGMAECDEQGNVNTSRFGGRLNGCGGFINISQNSRAVVFAGTLTAGGLKVAIEEGNLKIVQEGRAKKFVKQVEQITFSGAFAQERHQPVLYVTERCVFQLTPGGLELIEVARGIDIEEDILPNMDFKPIIDNPIPMDRRLFIDEPMELLSDLMNLKLWERVSYDEDRNLLFLNLEGWNVRKKSDIDDLTKVLVDACKKAGRRVNAVVNHDGCRIAEDLYDDYAAMIAYMLEHYYASTTRYTTSTFMRLKMQEALSKRGLAPHVFERAAEAHRAIGLEEDESASKAKPRPAEAHMGK